MISKKKKDEGLTLAKLDEIMDSMPTPEFVYVKSGMGMKRLIDRYGSWVRVQVAFYDFIFEEALEQCAKCINDGIVDGFADGKNVYEDAVKAIELKFNSFGEAWKAFRQSSF